MKAKRDDRIAFDLGMKRRDLRYFQELLSFVGRKRKPKRKLERRVARRVAGTRKEPIAKRTLDICATYDRLRLFATLFA